MSELITGAAFRDVEPAAPIPIARAKSEPPSTLIACGVVAIIIVGFLLSSDQLIHWFLIPVSICGVLAGIDAIDWIRERTGLYDPIGVLGVLGFHVFFLAPLLHVEWDFWIHDTATPPDWRPWLGYMAGLNLVGLVCYRVCRSVPGREISERSYWRIDMNKFRIIAPIFIVVSTVAQIYTYYMFGGISGYVEARLTTPQAFEGMGPFFMISESAPILIALYIIVRYRGKNVRWSRAATAMVLLFAIQLFFGGLRGSRSATVQLLFWVAGCVHFLIKPIPRKLVYLGTVLLIGFLYLYGFYKSMGANATQLLSTPEAREHAEQKTGRSMATLLLGDLARADVQAFILYKLVNDGRDFSYALGRTYIGAVSMYIPRFILEERPATKLKEGTEIQYGGYGENRTSSRVYGLAGEAMLNFGPLIVPVAFGALGLFVGWMSRSIQMLGLGDARFLLAPYAAYLSMALLTADSDNVVFGLAKNFFLPLLVVILCARRQKLRMAPAH